MTNEDLNMRPAVALPLLVLLCGCTDATLPPEPTPFPVAPGSPEPTLAPGQRVTIDGHEEANCEDLLEFGIPMVKGEVEFILDIVLRDPEDPNVYHQPEEILADMRRYLRSLKDEQMIEMLKRGPSADRRDEAGDFKRYVSRAMLRVLKDTDGKFCGFVDDPGGWDK